MAIDTTILSSNIVTPYEDALAAVFAGEGLDCTPGTAIRELVVRPTAVMHAHLETHRAALVDALDLNRVASGAIAGDDDLVDALASTYRVSRRSGTASRGSIALRLISNTTTYVGPSYSFYVGDYPLTVDALYVGVASTTGLTSTATTKYVQIRTISGRYYLIIPVTCASGNAFATGAQVQFTGDTGNISSVSVYSSITGGSGIETNQSLARRILYGVAPGVLSTPLQIQGGLGDAFAIAPHRVAVFGAGSIAQRRDTDPITGLPLGGRVDAVTAATGGCPLIEVTFTATSSGTTWTGSITDDAAGMYEIVELFADTTAITNFTVTWGAAASTLHRVSAATARYSSLQTATVTFVDASLTGASVTCAATVRRISDIKAVQDWVDASERRAPGQDTLVRAPIPCFLSVFVSLSGGELDAASLRDLIVTKLNDLPVGRGYVSAQDITDALAGTGTSINYPVTFQGRFILPTCERFLASSTGRLSMPAWPDKASPEEVAFFTDNDSVRVSKA